MEPCWKKGPKDDDCKKKKSANVGYKVLSYGHENYEDKWWKNKPRFKSKHIMWKSKQNTKR